MGRESVIEQRRERAALNDRLREERLRAAAEAKAAQDEARNEARREAAEKELRAYLHAQYMMQPAATEEDFTKAYPRLREEHLHREALAAPERERQALAASGRYSF